MSRNLAHAKWVQTQNGGPVRIAEWVPSAFNGEGGWRIEGRNELVNIAAFNGNYRIIDDHQRANPSR